MSALATHQAVTLRLANGCSDTECLEFAGPLYGQLGSGKYDVCSVLPVPEALEDWRAEHRTARKRADRCQRLGYWFAPIRRDVHASAIYEINTSLRERQGRPMSDGYSKQPSASPDPLYPCKRHAVRTYGVLTGSKLVAYLWLYRSGDMGLVSSILGHGDHLLNDVMYLLMQGVIDEETLYGGYLVYNRHDSGTDGLRYFKERVGFEPMEVEWTL